VYDYYKILEIPRDASIEEIKRAYRNKAKVVHPDINNSPKANEVFVVVKEAYETLIDKRKRNLHDVQLKMTDSVKADAERKKQYYGSSKKNNSYTNFNYYETNLRYDHKNSFTKSNFKSDEFYYRLSPVIYNMLFICGMFLGFIIVIVTVVGTFNDYWPKPFILISVLGFILIRQGWKGIVGKRTIVDSIKKKFGK